MLGISWNILDISLIRFIGIIHSLSLARITIFHFFKVGIISLIQIWIIVKFRLSSSNVLRWVIKVGKFSFRIENFCFTCFRSHIFFNYFLFRLYSFQFFLFRNFFLRKRYFLWYILFFLRFLFLFWFFFVLLVLILFISNHLLLSF